MSDSNGLPTHASYAGARRVLQLLWRRLYGEDKRDGSNRDLLKGLVERLEFERQQRAATGDRAADAGGS